MKVYINNQKKQLKAAGNINDLFAELGFGEPQGIAVAINDEVVPKQQWAHFQLSDNGVNYLLTV